MSWLAIVEMIIKFIPTLIKIVTDIVEAIRGKPAADASFTGPTSAEIVCGGVDRVICALEKSKASLKGPA